MSVELMKRIKPTIKNSDHPFMKGVWTQSYSESQKNIDATDVESEPRTRYALPDQNL